MSEYDEVTEAIQNELGDAIYLSSSQQQDLEYVCDLLQKYHDALVRLGDAEPMVARDFEKMSPMEWEVLEKRVRRRYANNVLESEE